MKAPDSFQLLDLQLARWQEAMEALRCTITEDRPMANDVALADCYDDATADALGWLNEARTEARRLRPGDRNILGAQILRLVHGHISELTRQYSTALAGWERVTALDELGARRGRQWQQWSMALRRALEALPHIIYTTHQVLTECWCEMSSQRPPSEPATIQKN